MTFTLRGCLAVRAWRLGYLAGRLQGGADSSAPSAALLAEAAALLRVTADQLNGTQLMGLGAALQVRLEHYKLNSTQPTYFANFTPPPLQSVQTLAVPIPDLLLILHLPPPPPPLCGRWRESCTWHVELRSVTCVRVIAQKSRSVTFYAARFSGQLG